MNSGAAIKPSWAAQNAQSETRETLLAAAIKLMIDKDSVDISLSEIALKTSLSAALVQYHFGSKAGLMMAILENGSARAADQLAALQTMPVSAEKKLRLHVGGLVTAYVKAPYLDRLMHALMQTADDAGARHISEIFIKPVADFHAALIAQGVAEGVFRRVDPMHFYFILVGACDHIVARRKALQHVFAVEDLTDELRRDYAETVYRVILAGIAAAPPKSGEASP